MSKVKRVLKHKATPYVAALCVALAGGAAYYAGEMTANQAIAYILRGLLFLLGGG